MKSRRNLWLLVIVVVAGLSAGLGSRGRFRTPAAPQAPRKEDAGTPVAPGSVHLEVLNGTAEAGLAREVGLLLGQAGWVAEEVGNAPHGHFARSYLVNRRLDPAAAARLARALGGVPVLQEFDSRTSADAVLVLGADAGRVEDALRRPDGS